jgi:hypothetical protein
MKISSQLKSGIYEVSFRYNTNLEVSFRYNTNLGGYTTLMSDIPKLYKMPSKRIKGGLKWMN